MSRRLLNVVLRSALCVALAASAVLFVDYRAGSRSSFCGVASGCAKVREWASGHLPGMLLPIAGVAVFSVLFLMSLNDSARVRRILTIVVSAVGVVALGLIAVQLFVVRALCPWCMAVDVSALVAAAAAVLMKDGEPEPPLVRVLWGVAAGVALGVPLLAGSAPAYAELPQGVAELQAPGKVTVVTFTDFECPFCRLMHPAIDEALREHADRVVVVRIMKPLQMHPGAEPAARVYLCTPAEQRDRLADKLYNAAFGTLDRKSAIAHAAALGVDEKALEACYGSADTDARLEHDRQLFEQAELRGLPTTFVGTEIVEGAETEVFHDAIGRALEGRRGGATWMVVVLVLVLSGAAGASMLAARIGQRAPEPARSAPS